MAPQDTPCEGHRSDPAIRRLGRLARTTSNFLAVANAFIGMLTTHIDYKNVDLDDPNNVRYARPQQRRPGQRHLSRLWVPNDVPFTGRLGDPLAPMLDNMLRPTTNAQPAVTIPDPTPGLRR